MYGATQVKLQKAPAQVAAVALIGAQHVVPHTARQEVTQLIATGM